MYLNKKIMKEESGGGGGGGRGEEEKEKKKQKKKNNLKIVSESRKMIQDRHHWNISTHAMAKQTKLTIIIRKKIK